MKQNIAALLCGMLFGVGLSLSHMINPNKVLGFLDVAGHWDASLLFVMLGALPVAMLGFKLILKRPAPLWADMFHLTKNTLVDKKLIIGACIFGIGWGLAGYCPGPVVAGLGLFSMESVVMTIAIVAGFAAYNQTMK